jgi:DNA-binding NtrC family response regulator/tetratricopeptide (TPR) repeat protein
MARPRLMPSVQPTERLLGEAPTIVALRAQLRHLVTFDTLGNPFVPTVLLQGETGTGKGLVARIIHDGGPRAQGPFVEVNCAAIPESLLEAELFGFEAGAFTDARQAKPGLWEAASRGTLFLDEIDAFPLTLQSKLLTVIEARHVRRLGAVVEHPVDVKLIAATQADLQACIAAGRFRADLYHRLAVVLIEVPPLRERGADVILLAQHYVQRVAEAHRLSPKRLSPQAEAWLQRYPWPGNVRELGHLMERVILLSPEPLIGPATLEQLCVPLAKSFTPAPTRPPEADTEAVDEAAQIQQALQQTAGNVARAARLLGMSRGAFRHRMARYQIAPLSQGGKIGVASPQERPRRRARPAVGQADVQAVPLSRATLSPAQSWEQKPVAVLAVEVTWPANNEGEFSPYEPWTVTSHWEQTMVEKVQGFGGVVLPHSPALVVAAFGVPRTLEQAPQRAVRAALALRGFVTDAHDTGHYPELRMALHYGEVLVDTEALDPTARLLPKGDTLARTGRLLGYAQSGEILASPEMERLVEGWCELRVCKELPGSEQTQRPGAYTIVGLRSQGAALQVHMQRPLSRFVGREQELTVLEDLLRRAGEGLGQIAGIIGEPGVGKSRLSYEFIRAHQTHGWLILEASANSYSQAVPYRPIIDLLKNYFQLDAGDDRQMIRRKITDKVLALEATLQPILPALFVLLNVPVEDELCQALDPSQRRQRFMDAVKHLLLRESQIQLLILVAENLHWIDGETQAFLNHLVEGLPASRILLLVSYRPEYQHGWTSKTYYTQLRLDPLPPASAAALLQNLLGDDIGLQPLKQCLIARTEGNPFFLEESVRTLVETQVLVGDQGDYRLGMALPSIQVPTTVQAVLAARIDRLPNEDKRLLQTAAAIGTEVPFLLLQAITQLSEAALHGALAHLQTVEFLYEARLFPEREYIFKHALTHEVAYRSLLQERRRGLHVRIVEAIETLAGERVTEQVERLVQHTLQGEVWDKALVYCRQAGEKALARSAHREAVGYFEQALSARAHLPDQRTTCEQAIDLQLALYTALRAFGEFARALMALREAEALAESLDDARRLAQVCVFLSNHFRIMGAFDQTIAAAQRALTLATASGDVVLHALVNLRLGQAYKGQDDYRRAIDYLVQSLASFDEAQRHERFGQAVLPAVDALALLASCHAELGTYHEGRTLGDEGLRIAEAVDHPASLMVALWGIGLLALQQGDLSTAIPWLERSLDICQEMDLPVWFPRMAPPLGAAYTLAGRVADAVPLLTQALEQTLAEETVHYQAFCRLSLGEAQLQAGRLEEAYALAERALALARERQERGYQAYALRLLGDIAAHQDPTENEQAQDQYRQALALAEELGMRPLIAHCHFSLGKLYAKIGHQEQARVELYAAIELYRAMDMRFWLPQAEAVLAQAV